MSTVYSSAIDDTITLPPVTDLATPASAAVYNALRSAIIAIESELGVKPSGINTTVRVRLDNLDDRLDLLTNSVIHELEDHGTTLAGGPFTVLNFTGTGVVLTNGGSGVANVNVAAGSGGSTLTTRKTIIDPDWYIDATTGNDSDSGTNALFPLKSWAGLLARWGIEPLLLPTGTVMTIHLAGDLPSSDPIALRDVVIGSGCSLIILGVATTVRSGSFTALTGINRASNIPLSATDGAMSGTWTTDLGHRVRITSGLNVGQKGWVAKDLGSKTARFSTPLAIPAPASLASFIGLPLTTLGTFTNGDPYVVETLSKIYLDDVDLRSQGQVDAISGIWQQVIFVDLDINSSAGTLIDSSAVIQFYGCSFTGTNISVMSGPLSGTPIFNNCGWTATGLSQTSGFTLFWGGLLFGSGITSQAGGAIAFDGDVLVQGGGISAAFLSTFIMILCAVFDAAGSGLDIYAGSVGTIDGGASVFGTTALWGSGNGGPGVNVLTEGRFLWDGISLPTLTGTGGDFALGGSTTARAFNEAAGDYLPAITCSWANITASIASGGFGGSAHSIDGDTHLLSYNRNAGVVPYVITGSNHTFSPGEEVIEFSAYNKILTLPDPGSFVGQEITCIAFLEPGIGAPSPGNEFVIDPGTKTINGDTSYTQQVRNETTSVKWNGTEWRLASDQPDSINLSGQGNGAPVNLTFKDGSTELILADATNYSMRIRLIASKVGSSVMATEVHEIGVRTTAGAIVLPFSGDINVADPSVNFASQGWTLSFANPSTTTLRITCNPNADNVIFMAQVEWSSLAGA